MTASRGIYRKRNQPCEFPECDRPARRGGLCDPHSSQMKRWGYCLPIGMKPRRAKGEGHSTTYTAVHQRLREWLGPASNYDCAGCGQKAKDWSYNGQDPNPLIHLSKGQEHHYTDDLSLYDPLCRGCHTKRDRYESL